LIDLFAVKPGDRRMDRQTKAASLTGFEEWELIL
jgi:hypothetical protein